MKVFSQKQKGKQIIVMSIAMILLFTISIIVTKQPDTISVSAQMVSNKKIEWGIKRNDNHEQPDLGSKNKQLIEQYKGMAMGNKEKKKVYLTFDEGYEAGYTPKILEVLKQNDVKATFFLTAHFVNTQEELVKQMIDEGHIVGNHIPKFLMSLNYKIIKC